MTSHNFAANPLDKTVPVPAAAEPLFTSMFVGNVPEPPEWLRDYDFTVPAVSKTQVTAEPELQSEPETVTEPETVLQPLADLDPILAEAVRIQAGFSEQQVLTKAGNLIGRNGGPEAAEDVKFWEFHRSVIAEEAKRRVGLLLAQATKHWSKPEEQRDVIDRVMRSVQLDHYGTASPFEYPDRKPDLVDFTIGDTLVELVKGDTLQDEAMLQKATLCIELLSNLGLYKLCQWSGGSDNQLQIALDLMETYTRAVPGFSPKHAGFEETVISVIYGLTALEADRRKIRDYEDIPGERVRRTAQLELAMERLNRTAVLQAFNRGYRSSSS